MLRTAWNHPDGTNTTAPGSWTSSLVRALRSHDGESGVAVRMASRMRGRTRKNQRTAERQPSGASASSAAFAGGTAGRAAEAEAAAASAASEGASGTLPVRTNSSGVSGPRRTHHLRPCSDAFHADVASGSRCGNDPLLRASAGRATTRHRGLAAGAAGCRRRGGAHSGASDGAAQAAGRPETAGRDGGHGTAPAGRSSHLVGPTSSQRHGGLASGSSDPSVSRARRSCANTLGAPYSRSSSGALDSKVPSNR